MMDHVQAAGSDHSLGYRGRSVGGRGRMSLLRVSLDGSISQKSPFVVAMLAVRHTVYRWPGFRYCMDVPLS